MEIYFDVRNLVKFTFSDLLLVTTLGVTLPGLWPEPGWWHKSTVYYSNASQIHFCLSNLILKSNVKILECLSFEQISNLQTSQTKLFVGLVSIIEFFLLRFETLFSLPFVPHFI